MKDRQDRSIANGVQKLANVPGSCQGSGFRFTVSDHCGDDQFWIVESSATGVREHVSQLTTFMDRTGRLRRTVTADTAGERKLLEELVHSAFVFAFFGIDLGVRSLEIPGSQHAGRAMPGTGHEDHVQVEFLDEAVQVNVDEG